MGLFKENATKSPDSKKRDGREKEKADKSKLFDEPDDQAKQGDRHRPTKSRQTSSRFTTPLPGLQDQTTQQSENDASHDYFLDRPVEEEPVESQSQSSALYDVFKESLPDAEINPPQEKMTDNLTDSHLPSKTKKPASFPSQLLEDIRNHHNLTPGADRYSSFSKSLRTPISERQALEGEGRRSQDSSEDPEKDEEVKEHISSALYYPHQGLSPEEVEQLESLEGQLPQLVPRRKSFLSPLSSEVEVEQPTDEADTTEHVDISLQSKHESQIFHGDYQRSKGPPSDVSDQLPTISEAGPESVFESEVDSLDEPSGEESSRTDGAEATPKGTPSRKSYLHLSRKRTSSIAGPVGAVELRPFSHQVGGHTTVFRFSRRAICKQLNNRENEFYERIERRHPDMLKFLPRFVL